MCNVFFYVNLIRYTFFKNYTINPTTLVVCMYVCVVCIYMYTFLTWGRGGNSFIVDTEKILSRNTYVTGCLYIHNSWGSRATDCEWISPSPALKPACASTLLTSPNDH